MFSFKQFAEVFNASRDTIQLFQALQTGEKGDITPILADSMEEDGNPNADVVRNPELFRKKFINWYGMHTLSEKAEKEGS